VPVAAGDISHRFRRVFEMQLERFDRVHQLFERAARLRPFLFGRLACFLGWVIGKAGRGLLQSFGEHRGDRAESEGNCEGSGKSGKMHRCPSN
jgi:hypothetical protein